MNELFQVLKDHKNPMIQELVNDSYEKCFQREMESLFGDLEFDADCGTENVVRCYLINPSYSSTLQEAVAKTTTAHYRKQCSERVQLRSERYPPAVSPDTERLRTL